MLSDPFQPQTPRRRTVVSPNRRRRAGAGQASPGRHVAAGSAEHPRGRGRSGRFLRRLVLWLLPVSIAGTLFLGWQWAEESAALDRAHELLVAGNYEAAREGLEPLRDSPFVGTAARAGIWIAHAFAETEAEGPTPDVEPFSLPLITRAAFDRGEFGTVLRLTELAETVGSPTVPLLTAAAKVEAGKPVEATVEASVATTPPPVSSLLVDRLRQHLADPAAEGTQIFARDDALLGRVVEGELDPASRLRPELLPRTLVALSQQYPDAPSIRTSLDLELAEAAYSAFGRYRGSIVLLDPRTGEILAAVSDRRTHRQGGTAAFEQYREPASISKLITTAAYLRSGRDADARLGEMSCRGHESYSGERLYCPVIAGRLLGLDRAMAVSCNVAFASLAVEIGRPRLLEELRRFGFEQPLGAFPGGQILEAVGDDRQLADLAIGLDDTALTPLHAALLASVVANGGYLPEPSLVHSTDGRLGLHPRLLEPRSIRRVLEPEWIEPLRDSMEAVVRQGTGMRVRTPGFPVAMKTGTASHPLHGFHVNYIGYGPLPNARVAFAVRITHQATSRQVRMAAAEVTARLLRNLRRISRQRDWQNDSWRPSTTLAELDGSTPAHPSALDARPAATGVPRATQRVAR